MISDTSPEVEAMQTEIYRNMTPAQKAQIVDELYRDSQRLAEIGVRMRYPGATDREVMLRVASLRNGREVMIEAFGWDPEVEGW